MCGMVRHMLTNFGDYWLKNATWFAENVTISFKHEYRRPNVTSRCDVVKDVISVKNNFSGIISNDLFISDNEINPS